MHHRHVSHLFGLFPGHTVTVEKTPDLCKAADNTLFKRGLYVICNILTRLLVKTPLTSKLCPTTDKAVCCLSTYLESYMVVCTMVARIFLE